MGILRSPSVPFYVSPLFRPALEALEAYLERRDYSQYACERIVAYAAANGTPTGCEYLDHPADEAGATEAFVAALPPVGLGSEAWDPAGVYLDVESILEAGGRRIPRGVVLVPPELNECEPTAEDLAEYGAWLEGLDREQVAAMMAPIAGGAPDGGDDWPRPKTAADRRRDVADVAQFYATHPGA